MSDKSGEALLGRIISLERRVDRIEKLQGISYNPPVTKLPEWSESHREDTEPLGTTKPYTRPDGTVSDTMVMIKDARGWRTAMIKDMDGYEDHSRDESNNVSTEGITSQSSDNPERDRESVEN